MPKSISVHDLKDMLENKENFILMDIREPEEFEICQINGSILVPYSEIDDHLGDFDTDREYVLHCKSGSVSEECMKKMKKQGFANIRNLEGGILNWAKLVEPTMETY